MVWKQLEKLNLKNILATLTNWSNQNSTVESDPSETNSVIIGNRTIMTDDLITNINEMKSYTSLDPDYIPNYVIKICATYLAPIFVELIFNSSLQ